MQAAAAARLAAKTAVSCCVHASLPLCACWATGTAATLGPSFALTPFTLASLVTLRINFHCSEPELKTEAVTGTSSGLNSDMADAFRKLASILSGARQLCAYCTAAVALLDGWELQRWQRLLGQRSHQLVAGGQRSGSQAVATCLPRAHLKPSAL